MKLFWLKCEMMLATVGLKNRSKYCSSENYVDTMKVS